MIELNSLADLAQHLIRATAVEVAMAQKGIDRATALLQREAKAEFGTYQDAAGPYPEWAELADSTKAQREALGYAPDDPLLRDGTLRDSIEREVGEWEGVVGSTSDIMPYHEFGTANMPPRPVLGPALFRNAEKITKMIGTFAYAGLIGYDRADAERYATRQIEDADSIHASLGYDGERSA